MGDICTVQGVLAMTILELETERRGVTFAVVGTPEPKGSMRAFVRGGRAVLTSDNPDLKRWQAAVRASAQRAMTMAGGCHSTVAASVTLDFRLPRPKALPKRRETPHVKRPDVDKLARGVLDALTGVVWADDSQVAALRATKRYAGLNEPPGAVVHVRECHSDDGGA
jgi:crossover junction endodeoxyribonuclease RusA